MAKSWNKIPCPGITWGNLCIAEVGVRSTLHTDKPWKKPSTETTKRGNGQTVEHPMRKICIRAANGSTTVLARRACRDGPNAPNFASTTKPNTKTKKNKTTTRQRDKKSQRCVGGNNDRDDDHAGETTN